MERKFLFIWAAILIILLLCGGYIYFRFERHAIVSHNTRDLITIARLKTDQLVAWQKERSANAENISKSPFFKRFVQQYLSDPADSTVRDLLKERLDLLKTSYHYEQVLLVDQSGKSFLSEPIGFKDLNPAFLPDLRKARETNSVISSDFIRCINSDSIRIATLSPISDKEGRCIAFLILLNDPDTYIYPLIRSWPRESETAETYLVEKQGDRILVLNDLRFADSAALNLSIPLTETKVTAVKAVLGEQGIVQGTDYKGEHVLAYISAIAGTPWFMVCKIDTGEIFRDLWKKGVTILLFVLAIILTIVLGAVTIAGSHEKRTYKALYEKEKALWASQQEFRTTLYSIGDGVISTDSLGHVVFMNPVAEKMTGYSEKEAIGKPLKEVFHIISETTLKEVENPVEQVIKTGTTVGLANHTLLVSADGKIYPVYDCGAPIYDVENNLSGVVLVFSDQTRERAAMKKIEESDRLKSIFLANMSHEIRTPLNAILGFSGLLDDPTFSAEDKSTFIQRINYAGQRLLRLINDIIDLSKLEAGHLHLIISECLIEDVLSEPVNEINTCELCRKKPHVNIRSVVAEELKGTLIKTDRTRLQQILTNLITNAIKYTDEGFVETGASVRAIDGKEWLEFYVKDTGIGIPKDKLTMIFERFRQAEENEFHEGSGLGLSIAKGIIEILGGTIDVISEVNSGTTFSFTIPYFPVSHPAGDPATMNELTLNLAGKTIIIAEDDDDCFTYLKELLAVTNAEIIPAGNGVELIRVLENRKADLILLDMKMPVKSGEESLHEIKSRGFDIKIIAQTAYAYPEDEERFIQKGCDGFLAKPLNKNDLFHLIKKVLMPS